MTTSAAPSRPRITFGIIVLNGEPFTSYNLRSIYPFAHEIIVVEGAVPAAATIADAEGHSRDGTLDTLRQFKAEEDPEGKLTIVTAEDDGHADGFWPGEKDEQSRAYARRATGDYLWQVDIDEFYIGETWIASSPCSGGPDDRRDELRQITFWGGLDYIVDGWYLRRGAARVPPALPMGTGLRLHDASAADGGGRRRARSAGWQLAGRGGNVETRASACITTRCCSPSRLRTSASTTRTLIGRSEPAPRHGRVRRISN